MTMTDAELAEIRARAEAALSGLEATGIEEKYMLIELSCYRDTIALLDEVAAMRKENERLREAVKAVVNSTELCSAFCHVARAKQVLSWYPAALHSATEDADDRTT